MIQRSVGPAAVVVSLMLSGSVHARSAARETIYPSAEEVRPLLVGLSIPEGALVSQDGTEFRVGPDEARGASIYVFYRGHW